MKTPTIMIAKNMHKAINEMITAFLSETKTSTRPTMDATVAHPTTQFQILPKIDFMQFNN